MTNGKGDVLNTTSRYSARREVVRQLSLHSFVDALGELHRITDPRYHARRVVPVFFPR